MKTNYPFLFFERNRVCLAFFEKLKYTAGNFCVFYRTHKTHTHTHKYNAHAHAILNLKKQKIILKSQVIKTFYGVLNQLSLHNFNLFKAMLAKPQ